MGVSFSCLFADGDEFENGVESVTVKSISFGEKDLKSLARSISFNRRDSDPTILRSLGSGRMMVEGSISFKNTQSETMISINAPHFSEGKNMSTSPVLDFEDPKHEAAVKLQKVYKSFRTRRKLADCAVLVELEQSWWNLLDSAELKQSSISFFHIEKQETAISRWSRARTRAAKVGKGLSKNEKAQKLALQHWLEAIDPRHRYGHNLHFYYLKWLSCQSREPFFYWLDIGEGRDANLVGECPRLLLQQQCIKYLGPMERKAYEVVIVDGKLLYKQSKMVLDTRGLPKDAKWIFVLSTSKTLYVGQKKKGMFQHSSFLAGAAASAAGRLVVENGTLKAVWPHSGHYQPTKENFQDLISFLEENNVNLADVMMAPDDNEDASVHYQKCTFHFRNNSSEEDLTKGMTPSLPAQESADETPDSERTHNNCELPGRQMGVLECPLPLGEYHMESRQNGDEEFIRGDPILHDQFGKKLCRTWTTGAGPRISCVRDHPSEIQSRALEQVNLSPRSTSTRSSFRSGFSPRWSTSGQCPERPRSPHYFRAQPSPLRRRASAGEQLVHEIHSSLYLGKY